MRQAAFEDSVRAVEARGDGAGSAAQNFGDPVVGQAFGVAQHDDHAEIRRKPVDGIANAAADFVAKNVGQTVTIRSQIADPLANERQEPARAAFVVEATVHDEPVEPRGKRGVPTEVLKIRQQLEKDLL